MPSSHLIFCHPPLLLPPIPPNIRVFSNEATLHMRWPKYWSFSFSIIPSKENSRADILQNGLVGSPCSPRDSQESSPTPNVLLYIINGILLYVFSICFYNIFVFAVNLKFFSWVNLLCHLSFSLCGNKYLWVLNGLKSFTSVVLCFFLPYSPLLFLYYFLLPKLKIWTAVIFMTRFLFYKILFLSFIYKLNQE